VVFKKISTIDLNIVSQRGASAWLEERTLPCGGEGQLRVYRAIIGRDDDQSHTVDVEFV